MQLTREELIERLRTLSDNMDAYANNKTHWDRIEFSISAGMVPYVTQALRYTAQILEEGQINDDHK